MANLGVVKSISGIVKAIAENGTERILSVGDSVAENERIITGDGEAVITLPTNGAEKNLGNNSSVELKEDAQQDALDEVAAIQAALANNPDFDPSDLPATAAGNAAAGGAGNEGHSIVSVDYLNPEMEPISGFETGGQTPEFLQPEVDPGEELLLKTDTNTNGTPVAGSITAFVDEDDLSAQGGNKPVVPEEFGAYSLATVSGNSDVVDGSDDLVDPTATTATGSLNASFGSDGAGDISFNAAATQPAGITSGGVALEYWVSDDGHTLVAYIGTGEGNEVIFTAQITDAGAYSITLYGQVDHALANAENNLVIDLGFTITDSNGDTAAGTLAYDIDDDSPLASDKSAGSFEEGTTTTIASDAADYLGIAAGADGLETISAFTGGLGTLFIENGALKYTAPASVNSNGVDVATRFNYTVTDNDGDSVTHTVDLNISDTGVGKVTAKGETIDEDDIVGAGGNPAGLGDDDATTSGSISYTVGADGLGGVSLSTGTSLTTVDGDPVNTVFNANGTGGTLLGYTGSDAAIEANLVFTVELTDVSATGADYTTTLLQALQHTVTDDPSTGQAVETAFEDNINLVVNVAVTDGDGTVDTSNANFTISIDDDSPLASDQSAGSFEEGTTTTIASDAVDYLGVAPGADGLESISAFTGGLGTLFIENGALKYTAPASVNSNGVDVATRFNYTVTDNDGDSVTHTVDLNISDTGVGKVTAKGETIDEDDIVGAGGNPAGLGDDDATTSGSISYTVGADGLGGVSLSTGTSLTTVDGDPVNTVFNADGTGGTLLGYTGSDATIEANWVFTVELTGVNATSADYTTTLLQALQHTVTDDPSTGQAVETAFEDNINLVVNVAVTDGDGTVDTSNANFTISIDDDTPVFGTANDGFMSNTDVGPIYLTGDLALSAGADGLESLTISGREGTIGDVTGIIGTNGSGDPIILTSGGEPLHYVTNSDGSISAVVDLFDEETETEIESVVFNVSVDDTDGSYTVEFFGIVDEASSTARIDLTSGNGGITGGSNGEVLVLTNAIEGITVTATATDLDGDVSTVNASGQGMGVAQAAEINGVRTKAQGSESQQSEVLSLKFTDAGGARSLTEIGFVADQLDVGETVVVDLYLAGVKVGSTLSYIGENAKGSSNAGDDFFVIKANDAGAVEFDEIQFSALPGTNQGESYRVDSLTLDTNPDVFDVTTSFDVTATDGDGDVVSTSFELTLDANEVIEGGAGNDVLVGNGGLETLIGGEGDDILTGNGSEFGGVEADTFEFSLSSGAVLLNSGDDTITDFTLGSDTLEFTDVIEVDGLAGIGLSDAISSVSDVDGDVVLGLTNGGSITLADIGTGLIDSVGALETLLTPSHIDVN
ncbi:MAG: retention module-containing protein [Cycloclasticus sp.]